jgi:hypothetical protein
MVVLVASELSRRPLLLTTLPGEESPLEQELHEVAWHDDGLGDADGELARPAAVKGHGALLDTAWTGNVDDDHIAGCRLTTRRDNGQ